jgi:hypothetical protein
MAVVTTVSVGRRFFGLFRLVTAFISVLVKCSYRIFLVVFSVRAVNNVVAMQPGCDNATALLQVGLAHAFFLVSIFMLPCIVDLVGDTGRK